MRVRAVVPLGVASVLVALAATPAPAASPDAYVLSTTQPGGKGFAPAFIGNGYLAGRQPADGQGFGTVTLEGGSGRTLPTQSEVQGFYAESFKDNEGVIERRAALPAGPRSATTTAAARTRWTGAPSATTTSSWTCGPGRSRPSSTGRRPPAAPSRCATTS